MSCGGTFGMTSAALLADAPNSVSLASTEIKNSNLFPRRSSSCYQKRSLPFRARTREGPETTDPHDRKESIVRSWMNYVGAALLVFMGVLLYSNPADMDLPTAETPILALPLIVLGLVWGGLAFRRALAIGGRGERHHEND